LLAFPDVLWGLPQLAERDQDDLLGVGGNLRVAVRAQIIANSYLDCEVEELKKAVPYVYVRGRFGPIRDSRAAGSSY